MKKLSISILAVILLFSIKTVFAQDDGNDMKNFRFGLKVKPNITWYKPDDALKFESDGAKMKFSYGLMTEFRLSKIICFSTGLEINSTGGGIIYKDTTYYIPNPSTDTLKFYVSKRTFKANYVDIPITLKMKTPEIGTMTYFGQFGVNASIRWNAKTSDKGHFANSTTEVAQPQPDATSELGFIQLGLNVGGGFEMNLAGTTSFTVSVNYHNGFTNALRGNSKILLDKTATAVKQNVKAKALSLSVGILF